MKKILIMSLLACGIAGVAMFSAYSPAPPTDVCINGSEYSATGYANIYTSDNDTVAGATTDTAGFASGCNPKFITFTNIVYKCAGSPTVTAACYAAADGVNYADAPITTFTVSPTVDTLPKVVTYTVNNPYGGNPNTNFMWVYSNSASSTISVINKVTFKK